MSTSSVIKGSIAQRTPRMLTGGTFLFQTPPFFITGIASFILRFSL
jgi:hypothetical protein